MQQSEQINELAAALAAAQGEFGTVTRDKTAHIEGPKARYAYRYADLASVLDAGVPALSKHGLALVQPMEPHGDGLLLHCRLLHSSGQWLDSTMPVPLYARPQETGSALTYARRYMIQALLGLASEDDDGKAAQDAEPPKRRESVPAPVNGLSDAQRSEIIKAATDKGMAMARIGAILRERWGIEAAQWSSLKAVPAEHFAEVLRLVRADGAHEPGADDGVVGADGLEGEAPAEPMLTCKHEAARAHVTRAKPGKRIVCPDCTLEVTAADLPAVAHA